MKNARAVEVDLRVAVIDEYGDLKAQIASFKPTTTRASELEATIRGWFDSNDPTESFVVEGTCYTLQVSACEQEREIFDMPKLARLIGIQRFLELCSFTFKHVDALIPQAKHWLFLKQERTGKRKLKPIPIVTERAA